MPSLKERISAGLASLRRDNPKLSPGDQAILEAAEQLVQEEAAAIDPLIAEGTAASTASDIGSTTIQIGSTPSATEIAAKERAEAAEKRAAAVEDLLNKARQEKMKTLLMEMKRAGQLLPAAESEAEKLMDALGDQSDLFTAFLAKNGKHVFAHTPQDSPRTETANGEAILEETQGSSGAFSSLRAVTDAMMKDDPTLGYPAAFNKACRQRPDLAAAYIEDQRAK